MKLDAIVARTARGSIAWLRKHGYVDDSPLEGRSNEAPAQTALDARAAIAMGRGNVSTLHRDGARDDGHGAAEERPDKPALAVERDGLSNLVAALSRTERLVTALGPGIRLVLRIG